nr:CPBP family intramembrane metalloprotease [Tenuifilaceae bacterium]
VGRLNISFKINKWFVVAWLIMPVIGFLTLGISLLLPEVSYSPEMAGIMERFKDSFTPEQIEEMNKQTETLSIHPVWLALFSGMFAGLTINAIAAFGEELGWRGFLLRQLSNKSFWGASLIIGFIWGIWHAPIILMGHNYHQHPRIGVLMMVIVCILLSFLFIYITLKTRSVIAAAVMHGTLNATAGIGIMMLDGGNDLTIGATGLAGFIAMGILILVIFIYDRYISGEKIFSKTIEDSLQLHQ